MSTSQVPTNIAEIAAPGLLGTVWNWMLYGVLVVQVYVYTYNFPGDRKLLKLLVYTIFLLETIQTAFTGADLYYWFVSGFGNINHLQAPYLSSFDVPIIGSVVSLTVQFFFAYRVWVLSDKKSSWLCLIICICSLVNAIAAFTGGVYTHMIQRFPRGWTLKVISLTWLTSNALADILITAAMLHYIRRRRSLGDAYFGDHVLSRIVRLTVETNVLTTTDAIISLLMISIFPAKNWYICPTAILGKLYSNSLLVSLNNRISIREASVGRGVVVEPRSEAVTYGGTAPPRPAAEAVHIELEKAPLAFTAWKH